jgi:hypothetical protein
MKFIQLTGLMMAFMLCFAHSKIQAQTKEVFRIFGTIDKFYPVVFTDSAWDRSEVSEIQLGRSSVHSDSMWRGSLIATFRYHTTNWGNGSNFIEADIRQYNTPVVGNDKFIAGWRDASGANTIKSIIIWLRGNTTYTFSSRFNDKVTVYDGSASRPLPYQEQGPGAPAHSFKTAVDSYVNTSGSTYTGNIYAIGGLNYFSGSVGIGTPTPNAYKLAVEGTIGARRIKVTQQVNWADFVLQPEYKLPKLQDVETFIQQNGHLPEIPSAKEVKENGVDIGEMNKLLLQKVEELTLYLIQQQKEINALKEQMKKQ